MQTEPEGGVSFRWLGISGVELTLDGHTTLIDPLFTPVPLRRALFCHLHSDEELVRRCCAGCDALFVSHAHYDHLLDAPGLARCCGAPLYGSANTCTLARRLGAPGELLRRLSPGEALPCGPWSVTAYPAGHVRVPLHHEGPAPRRDPPYRSAQYRMDVSYSFLFEGGGRRLLAGPGTCACREPLDALFCSPTTGYEALEALLRAVRPALFVPIHWDNLFRRDGLRPGLDPAHVPHRYDPERLGALARACGARFLLPERLRSYRLEEWLK